MSRYLTVAQAAEMLCVCERTIRRAIADGRLSVLRVGSAVRIDGDVLEATFAAPPPPAGPRTPPARPTTGRHRRGADAADDSAFRRVARSRTLHESEPGRRE